MFCARCGAEVGKDARSCPACGADLWGSGALRLTSTQEPAQSLEDVFGTKQPPAEWFSDPVATRTEPRPVDPDAVPVEHPRFVPQPDPDRATWVRVRSAVVVGAAIVVAAILMWVFHHLVTNTFQQTAAEPVATPSAAATTATAAPASTQKAAPAPKPAPTPTVKKTRPVYGSIPASAKDCGKGVGAGSSTSCGLARAVAAKVPDWPPSSFTVTAKSPATGQTYTMKCSAAALTICTGGRSALVYVLK